MLGPAGPAPCLGSNHSCAAAADPENEGVPKSPFPSWTLPSWSQSERNTDPTGNSKIYIQRIPEVLKLTCETHQSSGPLVSVTGVSKF